MGYCSLLQYSVDVDNVQEGMGSAVASLHVNNLDVSWAEIQVFRSYSVLDSKGCPGAFKLPPPAFEAPRGAGHHVLQCEHTRVMAPVRHTGRPGWRTSLQDTGQRMEPWVWAGAGTPLLTARGRYRALLAIGCGFLLFVDLPRRPPRAAVSGSKGCSLPPADEPCPWESI
jgi:hypothetical protein